MKKTALIIAALAVAGVSYAADVNATTKPSYSVTSDFSYASEYVFRGVKYSGSAFQGSLEVSQDDFRVGVWTSQPLRNSAQNNEIDFYAGYKIKLDRDLSADIVATYYYYPDVEGDGALDSTYELGVGGTYDLGGMNAGFAGASASLYYYYDFRLSQQTVQGSIGYSIALADYGTSLDLSVFAGTVSARDFSPKQPGEKVRETWNYYGIGVNIPYKLADNAQVHVGANYANLGGYVDGFGGPKQTIAVTAGVTLGF